MTEAEQPWFSFASSSAYNTCDSDGAYSIDVLKANHEVSDLAGRGWFVLDTSGGHWLRFVVFEYVASEVDGTNPHGKLVFYGEGPSDTLRECRHTWWGEDGKGYVFYPNKKLILAALDKLSEYFDLEDE